MDTLEITPDKYKNYNILESIKDGMICGVVYEIPKQSEIVKINVFVGNNPFRTIEMSWNGQYYVSNFEPIASCLCYYHVISFRSSVINTEAKFYIILKSVDEDLVNKMKKGGIINIVTNELYASGIGGKCKKQYEKQFKPIEHVYESFWTYNYD